MQRDSREIFGIQKFDPDPNIVNISSSGQRVCNPPKPAAPGTTKRTFIIPLEKEIMRYNNSYLLQKPEFAELWSSEPKQTGEFPKTALSTPLVTDPVAKGYWARDECAFFSPTTLSKSTSHQVPNWANSVANNDLSSFNPFEKEFEFDLDSEFRRVRMSTAPEPINLKSAESPPAQRHRAFSGPSDGYLGSFGSFHGCNDRAPKNTQSSLSNPQPFPRYVGSPASRSFAASTQNINHWGHSQSLHTPSVSKEEAQAPASSWMSSTFKKSFREPNPSIAKRPSFPPAPNRFVAKQLQQASRDLNGGAAFNMNSSPIGLFLWGFPGLIRISDLTSALSKYGEIVNVGIAVKNGIKYAFVDFDSVADVQKAYPLISKEILFGMSCPVQVRLRFNKIAAPSFDNQPSEKPISERQRYLDKRTLHLMNLPHNINKTEIEGVLNRFAPISRMKIFQRSAEKKSSVFVTFKTPEKAKYATNFMKNNNFIFKDMLEPLQVEYPTQDISHSPPVFPVDPNAPPTLSKKARKLLAASNRLVYARSLDALDAELLESELSQHGPCKVYIIKSGAPSTAFVEFETPKSCSDALAAKTCGVTLPRHKRVDLPKILPEGALRDFLAGTAEIKSINFNAESNVTTVEFLTAIGAAKAIVQFECTRFTDGILYHCDYSPSLKPDEGEETNMIEADTKSVEVSELEA